MISSARPTHSEEEEEEEEEALNLNVLAACPTKQYRHSGSYAVRQILAVFLAL